MEEWKDIEGYEGFYQVSNEGRCRSLDRVVTMKTKHGDYTNRIYKGQILKKHYYPNGYEFFSLKKNGVIKQVLTHRLVAKAFIPNPQNKPCIDHINTIKTDNRVENLRWCTYSENNLNPITNSKLKDSLKKSEKIKKTLTKATKNAAINSSKKVYQYTLDGELVKIWDSVAEASKHVLARPQNIGQCALGKINTCKGFKWSYNSLEEKTLEDLAIS